MRRRDIHSFALAAALSAILLSLSVFPTLDAARYSLSKIPTAGHGLSAACKAGESAVHDRQHESADCTFPEGWLESRGEEEIEQAVAIDTVAVVAIDLDDATSRQCGFRATDFGRHLAWNPSAHAFSPSVHPIRC